MIRPITAIVLSALFSTVSGLATAQDLASFHAGMVDALFATARTL